MCHDSCHCMDYNPKICPDDCFRSKLTRDLELRPDLIGVPMTYSCLRGTGQCPLNAIEINVDDIKEFMDGR